LMRDDLARGAEESVQKRSRFPARIRSSPTASSRIKPPHE